jgi:hypothetical protein
LVSRLNTLTRLQAWFASTCDGEREHHHGLSIITIDNPGWLVKIDLSGTPLLGRSFDIVAKNVSETFVAQSLGLVKPPFVAERPLQAEWMVCFMNGGLFQGAGDLQRLDEILNVFLRFAER